MHVCHVNILNFQKYKMLETVSISTLQFNIVLNFIFVFKLIVRKSNTELRLLVSISGVVNSNKIILIKSIEYLILVTMSCKLRNLL